MKILQVIPYFYPAWRFGGPVRVAYDISKQLVKRGHSVVVYTSDVLDEQTRVDVSYRDIEGVDVYYFKNLSLQAAKRKMFITPSLFSALKNNARFFDIVHIHGNRTAQSPLLHYYLKKNSVPYVVQAHGGLPILNGRVLKTLYDLFFGRKLLDDASKVIALTPTEAQQYLSIGVPREKVAIIPNGIDPIDYACLPEKGTFKKTIHIPNETKIILYLGRLHPTKGLSLLLRAYALLTKRMNCNNTLLVLAGPDDGYLAEAMVLATNLGISGSVIFTGFIDNKNKVSALVDAEVFVTPSFSGFPLTFLEACATGTPIITTTFGDRMDWLNGSVGYVTPPSIHELAKAMYAIVSGDKSVQTFSNNCVRIAKFNFSISAILDGIEQLYKDVIFKN